MEKQYLSSRGIIIFEGKILVVKHKGSEYYSLPGGKPEGKESMKETVKRELFEELGIKSTIGELLFINEYSFNGEKNSIDFIFEIKNGEDFFKDKINFSENELDKLSWKKLDEEFDIKPDFLKKELKNIGKKGIKYFGRD